MSRYNHFSAQVYKEIPFADIAIGGKFRLDLFKNKRRRKDIIMIKTSELSYEEKRSKVVKTVFTSNFTVSSFDEKVTPF